MDWHVPTRKLERNRHCCPPAIPLLKKREALLFPLATVEVNCNCPLAIARVVFCGVHPVVADIPLSGKMLALTTTVDVALLAVTAPALLVAVTLATKVL